MEIESKIAVLGIEGPIQDRVLVLIPMCQVSRAISSRCLGKMPWPPSDMSMRPGSLDHDFACSCLERLAPAVRMITWVCEKVVRR